MGLFDRIRKSMAAHGPAGSVGIAPSDTFASSLDLIHAGLDRLAREAGGRECWLSIRVREKGGHETGVVQYSGGGLINLCDRDDVDLRSLLKASGREDLATRCSEREPAVFEIDNASVEEVAYALELALVGGLGASAGSTFEAKIEG